VRYDDFELADGTYPREPHPLVVWTQGDGQWACVAYDHGPFCRRCVHLDGIEAACLVNVIEGTLAVEDHPDLGWRFHLTDSGKARVETAIRRGGFDRGLDG
jgi:hypothetical protein